MHILVVDDSAQMRKIVINQVGQAFPGTVFTEAGNGDEGFNAFLAQPGLDLVLSDIHMPGCTGVEMLKRIMATGRKVPVVMISSEHERGVIVEALSSGAVNYVTKPFNAETLVSKIKQVLAGRKA